MSTSDPRDPAGGEEQGPPGSVGPTDHRPLVVLLVVGLVGGWVLRAISLRTGMIEPRVGWGSLGLLLFLVASVGATAWTTRRTVRRERFALAHHQAVNRLALAKACSLVGAVLCGGYAGYALAQLGVSDPGATARLARSGAAAVLCALLVTFALLLEHACRVPPDDDEGPRQPGR